MPDWLPFTGWLRGQSSSLIGGTLSPEGAEEVEGDVVGEAEESVFDCDEICSSSFHSPPSLTRPQTMTKRGVPVLSTKETSTVAVAVVPRTSSTRKEWMVELCIWKVSSLEIQLAWSCWPLKVGPK